MFQALSLSLRMLIDICRENVHYFTSFAARLASELSRNVAVTLVNTLHGLFTSFVAAHLHALSDVSEGLYASWNNRTVQSILDEHNETGSARVLETGERDGLRYSVYDSEEKH